MAEQAHLVASAEGVAETGYRVVFNTGAEGGQTVGHAHAHVLGRPADGLAARLRPGQMTAADSMASMRARARARAGKGP